MVHVLNILPVSYEDVAAGRKRSDIRFYDRDYVVGDLLVLQEYDVLSDQLTGRAVVCEIKHICSSDYLKEGYLLLSFQLIYVKSL